MYNKTIIGFGFRMISRIIQTSVYVIRLSFASADNTIDLGLNNSWYHAQPHPIIAYSRRTDWMKSIFSTKAKNLIITSSLRGVFIYWRYIRAFRQPRLYVAYINYCLRHLLRLKFRQDEGVFKDDMLHFLNSYNNPNITHVNGTL